MIYRLNDLLKKTDGIVLTSPYNMQYFSGFSGGEGAILITENERILFTDSRYTEQAMAEAKEFKVKETNNYLNSVCEDVKAFGLAKIGFEDGHLTAAQYRNICECLKGMNLISLSLELNRLRMVKTAQELEKMRIAEDVACRAFRHVLQFIKVGVAERDIALEIEYFMRKCGSDGISFDTIVVSGKKTSLPHGKPDGKLIENGDFVTMDFGCIMDGYCSDMTRTVVVGKASEEQKKIYNIVKAAQQTGLDAICAGISGKDADSAAREVIEKEGYGKYFGHSLGHGVGLLVHELPNLSPRSDIILEENMVVSCEPGIYIPDFGGVRIEDMVCVKKNGIENFTYETKELIEL